VTRGVASGPPIRYFSVPSRVASPVSTLTRKLVPFMPISRSRLAAGLKSTTARSPDSKGMVSRETCVARPLAGSRATICPRSVTP
jgi:hypothetical protein